MKIIEPHYIIMDKLDGIEILKKIERCGRPAWVGVLPGHRRRNQSGDRRMTRLEQNCGHCPQGKFQKGGKK